MQSAHSWAGSAPPNPDDWIARIRSRDALTYEDAYEETRPAGPGVVARLIEELHRSDDGYTRGKFAELLGEMGNESVIPVLVIDNRPGLACLNAIRTAGQLSVALDQPSAYATAWQVNDSLCLE